MCDFERALRNSLKKNIPWATVSSHIDGLRHYYRLHGLAVILFFW
jgi:hypothetical protein